MNAPRSTTLAVAAIALAVGLAGCGGGDDPAEPADLTAASEPTTAEASSAATTAAAPPKRNKRRPKIGKKALAFLAIDSCAKPKKGWWTCRSGDAVVLIRATGKPADVLEQLQARKDWTPGDSVVLAVKGGGVVYLPSLTGLPQFADAGPFPGLEQVDTGTTD